MLNRKTRRLLTTPIAVRYDNFEVWLEGATGQTQSIVPLNKDSISGEDTVASGVSFRMESH
jgi:hypothetical protein